ncbi:Sugar ABC transporter substrate-binding protein [Devosia sp. LC5]|uniref:ABC transporter substrate-binding protein n=1 Tax=Devosia sp. LC5 TaxID=1502724 RepID=UPI0004E3BEE7|nr:extracellular solute-binding protein [Devosia sp. LC5]KFC70624.1 Sugar ABC transporter substrate-binding protein [Devosia sp. LC5]
MNYRRISHAAMSGVALASLALVMSSVAANAETYHYVTARNPDSPVIKALMDVVAEFKETHPDFDITLENIAGRPAYLQKIKILATSGELPEIFDADAEPYYEDIVEAGLTANIGEIFDEIGITDKFIPFALDYERFDDGSLWLIPWEANVEYFYYHKDMFEKAGVQPPATLDEFLEVCTTLGETGVTPISVAGKEGWPMYRYLSMPSWRMMGNEFLDKLKVGEISMNSEAGLADARFFQDLGANCFQEGFASADYTTALNMFLSSQSAIYYVGTWELHSLLDENKELKDDIGYFKMPIIDENDATSPDDFYAHSGLGTAIRADAATDEMKEFLAFLADRFGTISHHEYGGLPSLKIEVTDEMPQIYKDVLADMEAIGEYARVWDVKLDAATVDTLFRQSQLLGLGEITPEQFAEEIDRSVQQYLSSR